MFHDFGKKRKTVQQLLEAAVARHLIADVPVSVFLSGGIDSSAITAFASQHLGRRLSTYSVGFDFPGGVNELPHARAVADHFGTEHHELHVEIKDVPTVLESLLDAHDVPFGDAANIPLYLLCKGLPASEKVVLQGDGGDEIFAGYRRYALLAHHKALRKAFQLGDGLQAVLPRVLSSVLAGNSKVSSSLARLGRMKGAFSQSDAMLMALLLTEEQVDPSPLRLLQPDVRKTLEHINPFERYLQIAEHKTSNSLAQQMLQIDTQIILPDIFLEKVDRSTMAHSVEVRVPFLDAELTDYVRSLPAFSKMGLGYKKHLLKRALRGVVPDEVLDRKKTGFSVPYGQWMKGALGDMLLDLQTSSEVRTSGLFDAAHIEKLLGEHRAGTGRHDFLLYKALTLSMWVQRGERAESAN